MNPLEYIYFYYHVLSLLNSLLLFFISAQFASAIVFRREGKFSKCGSREDFYLFSPSFLESDMPLTEFMTRQFSDPSGSVNWGCKSI
jgi:hypothetical protein